MRAPVETGYRIFTERFDWGGTDVPNKVYYELWYDKGYYCGANVRESNIKNRSTHLFAAEFIDIKLWNITDPSADVYVDFTVWYYTYLAKHEDKVRAVLLKTPTLLTEIVKLLKTQGMHTR